MVTHERTNQRLPRDTNFPFMHFLFTLKHSIRSVELEIIKKYINYSIVRK